MAHAPPSGTSVPPLGSTATSSTEPKAPTNVNGNATTLPSAAERDAAHRGDSDDEDEGPLPDGCFQFSCFNVKHWEARHSDPDWLLLLECVSEKHRERIKKFYNFVDAKRSLVGHLTCRIILAKLLQQQYEKLAKIERLNTEKQRQREQRIQQQAAAKVASSMDAAAAAPANPGAPSSEQPKSPRSAQKLHSAEETTTETPLPPRDSTVGSMAAASPSTASAQLAAGNSSGKTSPRRPTLAARLREHPLMHPPPSLADLVGEISKKPLLSLQPRSQSCMPPLKFPPLRGKKSRQETTDSDNDEDDEDDEGATKERAPTAGHSADGTSTAAAPTKMGQEKSESEQRDGVSQMATRTKTSLSQFLARIQFAITKENKPYLPKLGAFHTFQGLNFNISHSGDWVLLGITSHVLVGVDVEEIKYPSRTNCNAFLDNMRECFTRHEWNEIIKVNPRRQFKTREDELVVLERFFIHWVLKESFLKAIGKGILFGMHRAEFRFNNSRNNETISFICSPNADNAVRRDVNIISNIVNGSNAPSQPAAQNTSTTHSYCELYDKTPVLFIDGRPREGWRFVVKKMDKLHVAAVALGPFSDSEISTSFRSTLHTESDSSSEDEAVQPKVPAPPSVSTTPTPTLDLTSVISTLPSTSMDTETSSFSDVSSVQTEDDTVSERPSEVNLGSAMRRAKSSFELDSNRRHHHRRNSEDVVRSLLNRPIVFEQINADIFRELLTEAKDNPQQS